MFAPDAATDGAAVSDCMRCSLLRYLRLMNEREVDVDHRTAKRGGPKAAAQFHTIATSSPVNRFRRSVLVAAEPDQKMLRRPIATPV